MMKTRRPETTHKTNFTATHANVTICRLRIPFDLSVSQAIPQSVGVTT